MTTENRLNIEHLLEAYPRPSSEIHWVLAMSNELGNFYRNGDELVYHNIPPESVYFQGDYLRKPSLGHLDPALTVQVSDVHTIPSGNGLREGFVFLSPPYYHKNQYVNEIRPDQLRKLLYDQLISLGGVSGLRLGDHLQICAAAPPKRLVVTTAPSQNGPDAPAAQVLLGGPGKDQVISFGMGVTFRNSAPHDQKEQVPELAVLQGLVTDVDSCKGEVSVQVVLKQSNLAKFMQWRRLGDSQVLQTNLMVRVNARDIEFVHRILPYALHQHGGQGAMESGSEPYDLVIVGHLDIVVAVHRAKKVLLVDEDEDIEAADEGEDVEVDHGVHVKEKKDNAVTKSETALEGGVRPKRKRTYAQGVGHQPDSRALLDAMHGHGRFSVTMKLFRVAPLQASNALQLLAENARRFGCPRPGFAPYLHHIRNKLFHFALDKTRPSNSTLTDNTLHLKMCGNVFAHMLNDLVPWSETLTRQNVVSLERGVLMVELPTFESASTLLQQNSGLFDFTNYQRGFVELYAPIVFKWEMYDTVRTADTSRSVDGFVAITFAGYETRNAHNNHVINDTIGSAASNRQLRQIPSKCPLC